MASPIPTLVGSIVENGSDGTILIPNTTPPAIGDFLMMFIGAYAAGGTRSLVTPSGWTFGAGNDGDEEICAVYYKIAASGDVSAGNFTVTISGSADVFSGAIIKATGVATGAEVAGVEADTAASGATMPFTTNLAATTPDSLLLAMYMGSDGNGAPFSIGTYTSTPSLTWTELVELQGDNGSPVMTMSVASAPNTGTSAVTLRTAVPSITANDGIDGVAIMLNGRNDASGTTALLSADADFFTQAGSSGTSGTSALLSADADFFTQSGRGTTPTVWTDQTKNDTTWTNQEKS